MIKKYKNIGIMAAIIIVAALAISQVTHRETVPSAASNAKVVAPAVEESKVRDIPERTSVETFEVQALTNAKGDPKGILLTFVGKGFYLTSLTPSVKIGEVEINNTEINKEGTELYVIIDKKLLRKIKSQDTNKATIVMPGYRGDEKRERRTVSVDLDVAEVVNYDKGKTVKLEYRENYFTRE